MKSKIIIVFFLWSAFLNAHVGICTANQHLAAALDIQSGVTYKGVLLLHMSTLARTDINNPAESLLLFDKAYKAFYHYSTSTAACIKGLKICK